MTNENVQPRIVCGLPVCSESCPSHDGKRCRVLGLRPDRFCEPALDELQSELEAARRAVGKAWFVGGVSLAEAIERKCQVLELGARPPLLEPTLGDKQIEALESAANRLRGVNLHLSVIRRGRGLDELEPPIAAIAECVSEIDTVTEAAAAAEQEPCRP